MAIRSAALAGSGPEPPATRHAGETYDRPVRASVAILCSLLGAGWGLLLPALVYRYSVAWPDGEPQPPWRRTCVRCQVPLPVWWRPAWRCRVCAESYGPSLWATVPTSVVVFALVGGALGDEIRLASLAVLVAFLVFAALGLLLAFVDFAVMRLPQPLLWVVFVAGVALLTVAALAEGHPSLLVRPVLGALVSGAVYVVLAALPGSHLGYGDVKLGAVAGMYLGWLGWPAVLAGLILAPLVNLPIVLTVLVTRRAGRKSLMPYGPAMLIAVLVSIILLAAQTWVPQLIAVSGHTAGCLPRSAIRGRVENAETTGHTSNSDSLV